MAYRLVLFPFIAVGYIVMAYIVMFLPFIAVGYIVMAVSLVDIKYIAGGEIAFADLMNQQAAELGMSNTEYMNSTGLPAEGMFTSARDLSTIARAIIRDHPKYYSIYAKKYFEHNNINQPNRNRLLWRDKSVDGLKTGKTDAAGYCLVASAKRRDMRLISVSLYTSPSPRDS